MGEYLGYNIIYFISIWSYYNVPNDVNHIYFFNPFLIDISFLYRKELLIYKNVIHNIKESYKQNPRKITIIFNNILSIHDRKKEINEIFNKNFKLLNTYDYIHQNTKLSISFFEI